MATLAIEFKKTESDDAAKSVTFYSESKSEKIIDESHLEDVFQSIYCTIISKIQKYIDDNFNILKYNRLAYNSYIKLLKELNHTKKIFINIQNTDNNKCYR